jgi:hypothetical protein
VEFGDVEICKKAATVFDYCVFFLEFRDVEICKKAASEYRSSKAPFIVISRSKCTRALACKEFLQGLNNVMFDEFI